MVTTDIHPWDGLGHVLAAEMCQGQEVGLAFCLPCRVQLLGEVPLGDGELLMVSLSLGQKAECGVATWAT